MFGGGFTQDEPFDQHDAKNAEPSKGGEHGDVDELQGEQPDCDVTDEEGGREEEYGELTRGAAGNLDDAEEAEEGEGEDADAELSEHEGVGEGEVKGGEACLVDEDAAQGGQAVGEDDGEDEDVARGGRGTGPRASDLGGDGGGNGGGASAADGGGGRGEGVGRCIRDWRSAGEEEEGGVRWAGSDRCYLPLLPDRKMGGRGGGIWIGQVALAVRDAKEEPQLPNARAQRFQWGNGPVSAMP